MDSKYTIIVFISETNFITIDYSIFNIAHAKCYNTLREPILHVIAAVSALRDRSF